MTDSRWFFSAKPGDPLFEESVTHFSPPLFLLSLILLDAMITSRCRVVVGVR